MERTGDQIENQANKSNMSDEAVQQAEQGTEENKESLKQESNDGTDASAQTSPRATLEMAASNIDSDSSSSSGAAESLSADKAAAADRTVLESQNSQWRSLISGLILKKKRSMRRLSTFPPSELMIQSAEDGTDHRGDGAPPQAMRGRPSWRSFDYRELAVATDDFNPDNLIGKGGHAEVYKGCLPDGQLVAVKRLTKGKTEEEKIGDFLSELGIIAHVDHPNAAQLLGFSVEGGLHLVLKFSPHGSLASLLHGSKEGVEWHVRFKIALGVAQGLHYLHEGCHRRIIHRDIKASNILLKEDYQPQISDFGLAKWLPEKWSYHTVFPIEGTFGYLAPEYFMHGVVNEKTDVFAFGVILLELITGRRAVDSHRQSIVMWAKPLLNAKNIKELADPSLGDAYNPDEMKCAITVASMCIHHVATSRPSMNWVVRLLRGEDLSLELMKRELKPGVSRPLMFDACDTEEYTCSRYLNDLNRYKQLALEQ